MLETYGLNIEAQVRTTCQTETLTYVQLISDAGALVRGAFRTGLRTRVITEDPATSSSPKDRG